MRAAIPVLACAAVLCLASCREVIVRAPSLLLITTSALPADHLSCYGASGTDGAGICALADRGALFVWAFSTHPLPAPAAATLLTSLEPDEHGVTASAATFLRSDIDTIAASLAAGGLSTAAFVASPRLNRSRNLQLGFDHYEVVQETSPAATAARTTAAFEAWLRGRRQPQRAWFVWIHYPPVGSDTPPLRPLSLAELDAQVVSAVTIARERTAEEGLAIGFSALAGETTDGAPALALRRVRVPMIWTPVGGVVGQKLAAPVALLDLGPTLLQQAGVLVPASLRGEPLRVGALPPAAARPARPLRLAAGDEVGIVSSRIYYARGLGDERARTALLPDDGAPPRITMIRVDDPRVQPYEAELGLEIEVTEPGFHANGTEVPTLRDPTPTQNVD